MWLIPELSVEGRLWMLPGSLGTTTGFEIGLLGHVGSGRHAFLLDVGLLGARESSEAHDYAPVAGLGYAWRGRCSELRVIAGAFFEEADSGRKIYPASTLTWSVRFPESHDCEELRARRPRTPRS